jgi:hypothetical protein
MVAGSRGVFQKHRKIVKTTLSDGFNPACLSAFNGSPKEKSSSLKHKLHIPAFSKASKWFDFFHLILTFMPVLLFLTPAV